LLIYTGIVLEIEESEGSQRKEAKTEYGAERDRIIRYLREFESLKRERNAAQPPATRKAAAKPTVDDGLTQRSIAQIQIIEGRLRKRLDPLEQETIDLVGIENVSFASEPLEEDDDE
jgi:hypothetical protein